jgi:hypothetical protein
MGIVLRYLESLALPQPVIPLPNIVKHDVYGIRPQTYREEHEILGDGVVPLKGRAAVSQEKPPR